MSDSFDQAGTGRPALRVGSLFAGVGGFDLGLERAGMTVVWQSEVDRHASAVLAHRWPDVTNYGDVKEMKPDGLPDVDVLVGGFPCQDYSVAGSRGGLAGDRGALWWDFHRIIAGTRPTWVVGENVPGLLSSNGGRDFGTIVGSLVELGYGVTWRVLDAQYFGVAQRRRRVFIVGHSGGIPRPEVLALAEGSSGDHPPSRESGQRVAPTLEARVGGGGGTGTDFALNGGLVATLEAKAPGGRGRYEENHVIAFAWQAAGKNDASGAFNDDGTTPTLPASQTLAVAINQRDEVRELDVASSLLSVRSGLAHNETLIAETLRTNWRNNSDAVADAKSKVYPPDGGVRRLTPLECERLQGFPDGWTSIDGNSDTQRYRQMGNAVAVPVTQWIGERITQWHE